MSDHLAKVKIELRVRARLVDIMPPGMDVPDFVLDDDDAAMLMEACHGDVDAAADKILGMMGEAFQQLVAELRSRRLGEPGD